MKTYKLNRSLYSVCICFVHIKNDKIVNGLELFFSSSVEYTGDKLKKKLV